MLNMMRIISISVLVIIFTTGTSAFGGTDGSYDSTQLVQSVFPENALQQLRQDDDLNYPVELREKSSLMAWVLGFFALLYSWFQSLFSNTIGSFENFMTLLYIISGSIILYLFYRLFVSRYGALFSFKNSSARMPYEVGKEDIHEINFAEEIQNAVNASQYGLAVRLVYLQALKELSDHQQIHWDPGKTNRQYYYEISNQEVKGHFQQLSYDFSYIWYGHFEAKKNTFDRALEQLNSITKNLKA